MSANKFQNSRSFGASPISKVKQEIGPNNSVTIVVVPKAKNETQEKIFNNVLALETKTTNFAGKSDKVVYTQGFSGAKKFKINVNSPSLSKLSNRKLSNSPKVLDESLNIRSLQ